VSRSIGLKLMPASSSRKNSVAVLAIAEGYISVIVFRSIWLFVSWL